jgi:transcriptional regulator with XRE-family HTH domain
MEKSVFSRDYRIFTEVLRDFRTRAELTQDQLAEKVGQTQSYISKYERGELRLDLVQLRQLCTAMGTELSEFVAEFEERLRRKRT